MVNSNIPMQGYAAQTGDVINNAVTQERNNAMATEQILGQHYQNMTARDKQRLSSTLVGAVQLKSFLDAGDNEGAKNFLMQRKTNLRNRMALGEDLDTEETDYALKALESGNTEELKNNINGLMAAGQVYGLIERPNNAYLQQFAAVKQAHPNWTDAQVQDYVYTRGQVGKSTVFDGQGNVVNQPGAVNAASDMARSTSFAEGSGKKAGEKVIENDATLSSLSNLEYSIAQAEQLLPTVGATGPIFGRAGAAAEDPNYKNLQGAINAITLQAKDLYNLGSGAGFTDADRDFLREVIAGQYARAETIQAGLARFKQALQNRRNFVQQQNQQYQQTYGGQGVAGGAPGGMPPQQTQPQTGGKVRVSNGQKTFEIDEKDLQNAERSGYRRQ